MDRGSTGEEGQRDDGSINPVSVGERPAEAALDEAKPVPLVRAGLLRVSGVLLFLTSLAAPAIQAGDEIDSGFFCFLLGAVFFPGLFRTNLSLVEAMGAVGTIANLLAFTTWLLSLCCHRVTWVLFWMLSICVLFLLLAPALLPRHNGVSHPQVFLGYYLWPTGLFLIGLGAVRRSRKRG